ncbi:MAG: rRNA adenine N-6-methyltransferase family protein [Anaerolineae bacterium]
MADKAYLEYQKTLIAQLKQQDGLLDKTLEAAFMAVPRHVFLPKEPLERAYSDDAIAIKQDTDGTVLSSSSQPSMMALMLRQLRLRKGDNVLEIGAGTGYNAAIMQYIVGERGNITSIELDPQLAQQAVANLQKVSLGAVVDIVNADGAQGYAPRASYDRIIATAALWDVPTAWVRQLKDDGILVAPIWVESMQVSAAFVLQPDGSLYSRHNLPCGFIPLRGMAAGPNLIRHVVGSTLTLSSIYAKQIDGAALNTLLSDDAEINNLSVSLTSGEFWRGFLPYLTLNTPDGYQFFMYSVTEGQNDYGLEDSGFGLLSRGSACFVRYGGKGLAQCFGSADAFLAMDETLRAWDKAKQPNADRLRLQLLPKGTGDAVAIERPNAKIYRRQFNDLLAWLEV